MFPNEEHETACQEVIEELREDLDMCLLVNAVIIDILKEKMRVTEADLDTRIKHQIMLVRHDSEKHSIN